MKEIVINCAFGGFGLSHKATLAYLTAKGHTPYWQIDDISKAVRGDNATVDNSLVRYGTTPTFMEEGNIGYFSASDIVRGDPDLVDIVKRMGKEANGPYANLRVVEIPDGVDWELSEYDGLETVEERHRSWS